MVAGGFTDGIFTLVVEGKPELFDGETPPSYPGKKSLLLEVLSHINNFS
jgi:hypothetical protein